MLYLFLAAIIIVAVVKYQKYTQCSYYRVTKNSPLQLYFDKGILGEYMTYKYLREAEKGGAKFLFNIYIPKGENETTEIDVLLIHSKGLFVFESKNYSGWIFGNEYQRNWYQTLPQGRGRSHKEAFYNPVMQNRTHIKHLKSLLGEDIPMHSVITFSERCTLKKVEIKSGEIYVINRDKVYNTVASICAKTDDPVLNDAQIAEIYDKLYPYTQVDAAEKARHIENIEKKQELATVIHNQSATVAEKVPVEDNRLQEGKCPKCGGTLVLRTASKGVNAGKKFLGCSNFPKCRFVEKIED